MSLYQCEKCGCIENTALGWYHCRNRMETNLPPELVGKKLCSVCGPTKLKSGEPIGRTGEWHGKFERRFFKKDSLCTNEEGCLSHKDSQKTP